MAYQAKRKKRFEEEFQLVDASGNVQHTLQVALDADDMLEKIYRLYAELTKALYETNETRRKLSSGEMDVECLDKLESAVQNLFGAVFGPENTDIIVEFYEGRYIEMVKEVAPFIGQVVLPRIAEIKKENRKSGLASYNRKTRRFFGK